MVSDTFIGPRPFGERWHAKHDGEGKISTGQRLIIIFSKYCSIYTSKGEVFRMSVKPCIY